MPRRTMNNNSITISKKGSKAFAWMKVVRIQFYPMAWITYSLGAACAAMIYGMFHLTPYIAGLLCIALLELCTVLVNEYFDYDADRLNQNASPFTGGSRMLVEGRLSFKQVKSAIIVVLGLLIMSTSLLVQSAPNVGSEWIVGILLLGLFLGVGYTAPPMKFCYRGIGEIVVAFTHSPYVLLSGFFFQVGTLKVSVPWLLNIPLFFAVHAAITLSALPDYSADMAVSKKSIAVLFGPHVAAILAAFSVAIAVVSVAIIVFHTLPVGWGILLLASAVPHALILSVAIARVIKRRRFDCRLDGVMQLALFYILWFGLIPLVGLLWR